MLAERKKKNWVTEIVFLLHIKIGKIKTLSIRKLLYLSYLPTNRIISPYLTKLKKKRFNTNMVSFRNYSCKYDETHYFLDSHQTKVLHMNCILLSKFAHFIKDLNQLFSATSKSKTEEDT